MRHFPRSFRRRATFLIAAAALNLGSAAAATYQWDPNDSAAGLGGTGTWADANTFWDLIGSGGDAGLDTTAAYTFTASDTALFGGTAGTVTRATGFTTGALTFNTSGYTLNLTGTTAQTYSAGAISGDATINVSLGSGTTTANFGTTNWSGFTGTLNIGAGQAAGSGKVAVSSAEGRGFSSAATVNVTTNSTLYVASTTTHAAALVLNGGDTGETLGQLRVEGGATWSGAVTLAGAMTGSGDAFIGANSGTGTISGIIGESGGSQALSKGGAGTVILSGLNTYTGITRVNAGFLSVSGIGMSGAASNLGTQGTIDIAAGTGGLIYTGTGETTDKVIRYNSTNAGGVFTNNGAGTLTFSNTFGTTGTTGAFGVTFGGFGNTAIVGITNPGYLINFNKTGTGIVTVTGSLDLKAGALNANGGILRMAAASSTGSDLNAVTITRNATAGTNGVLQIASGAQVYTSTANTNGILGGWATFDNTTWAVTNGTASAVSGLASFTNDTWAAANNTDVTLAGANPASGSTTNTLRFNAAGAKTLTLAGTNLIAGNGLLVTSNVGNNATTITGGTLTAGALNASTDLVVHQHNTANALTIASVIANNGTGTTSLTKVGAGTLILSASNTYGGTTNVLEGTLQVNNGSATNTKVTLAGGNLTINNGVTYNIDGGLTFASSNSMVAAVSGTATIQGFDINSADIIVNSGVTASIASSVSVSTGTYGIRIDNTGNLTIAGAITGTGQAGGIIQAGTMVGSDTINVYKKSAGDLTLTGVSTFTAGSLVAGTSVQQGRLILSGGDNRLPTASVVYLGSTSNTSARLVLDGVNQTVTGLQGVGTGTLAVVGNSATLSTLTVNNTNNYAFSGSFGGTGTNENNIALVKSGAGTLAVSGTANTLTGGITVSAGTLQLTGAGTLGLNGVYSGSLTNNGTLQFSSTANQTISGTVSGTGALIKDGTGTLSFDYTTGNTTKLTSGALTLAAGTLRFVGNAGADTNQNIAGLTLGAGGTSVFLDTAAGRTLTVDFSSGAFTNSSYGLAVGTTGTGIARVRLPGTVANSNVANVIFNDAFASTDANNYLTGGVSNNSASDLSTWTTGATQYTTTGSAFFNSVGAGVAIDGIIFKDTAARTVTIGTGNTLTLTRGVIVTNAVGNNVSTLTGGSIQAASAGALTLYNANTLNDLTIASAIADNAGSSLVKSGVGTVVLSSGNTYAGGTTINAGILRADVAGSLGTGAVTANVGGVLKVGSITNSSYTLANAITLNGGGMIWCMEPSSGGITFSGVVTVTGANNVIQTTYDSRPLILSGGLAGTGTVTFRQSIDVAGTSGYGYQGGIIRLTADGSAFTGTAIIQNQNSSYPVSLEHNNALASATVQMGANGLLRLSTASATVAGLTGTATTAKIFNADATARTFTVNNSAANSFSGSLGDGTANGNNFSFVKTGSGTLTLAGSSTYSGGTVVNGGTLSVTGGAVVYTAGNAAGLGSGNDVTVNAGATLVNAVDRAVSGGQLNTRVININGGTLTMTGQDYFYQVNLTGGTVNGSSLWRVANSGLITTFASATTSTISAPVDMTFNNLSVVVADGAAASDLTISGAITQNTGAGTGAKSLTKSGSGTLTLSATSSYTGGTTVSAGVLDLAGGGGGSGTIRGAVTVESGATLRLSTNDATGSNADGTQLTSITLNGGTLQVNTDQGAAANQTLSNAAVNMTGAAITGITGSNLDFFNGASALNTLASATTSTVSGVKLSIRQTAGLTVTVADGAAAIDLDVASVVRNDNSYTSAKLIKAGAGTMRLTGTNVHTGGTTLNAGTLITGNTAALGAGGVALAGGALQVGDGVVNTLTLAANQTVVTTAATASVLKFNSATSAIALSGTGKYDFSVGTLTLDLNSAFNSAGTYNLITGGTANVDAASYAWAGADTTNFGFSFTNGQLFVTAIP